MKSGLKIFYKKALLLSSIVFIFMFNGKENTNLFFNTFEFVEDINPNIGWLVLFLSIIWLIRWAKDLYIELTMLIFYVSFFFWLSFFFGDINPGLGLLFGKSNTTISSMRFSIFLNRLSTIQ